MVKPRHVARDVSYASSGRTRTGRAIIRTVENLTGRPRMIRRVKGYDQEVANGRNFWEVMVERYELGLNVVGGSLDNIPNEGPVVVIANHPYGILDGMIMGHILSKQRGDFRILANSVFKNSQDLNKIVLPISFDETKEALRQNVETRKTALNYLSNGGCIGIFPGGTVSTAKTRKDYPMDPMWRTFTAKLIAKSGATVVPLYFDGANGRLFQRVSRLNATLRLALLIREFKKRVGDKVNVVVGEPINEATIAEHAKDPQKMMHFLREETYKLSKLSPKPLDDFGYGFEFEDHHR